MHNNSFSNNCIFPTKPRYRINAPMVPAGINGKDSMHHPFENGKVKNNIKYREHLFGSYHHKLFYL